MFAQLTAKAVLAFVAIAMAFFGVGLLGMAMATALAAVLGVPGAYALVGAILLVPPVIWAAVIHFSREKKPVPPPGGELGRALLGTLARETPWAAVAGLVLTSAANIFLNRNRTRR